MEFEKIKRSSIGILIIILGISLASETFGGLVLSLVGLACLLLVAEHLIRSSPEKNEITNRNEAQYPQTHHRPPRISRRAHR